jgi:peptide chain release factor 1
MFSKLKEINDYYEQIQQQLNSDTVASDYLKYNELLKEKKRIEPIVQKYREYTDCQLDIDTAIALISDEDLNSE